jgi:hypothetical protein
MILMYVLLNEIIKMVYKSINAEVGANLFLKSELLQTMLLGSTHIMSIKDFAYVWCIFIWQISVCFVKVYGKNCLSFQIVHAYAQNNSKSYMYYKFKLEQPRDSWHQAFASRSNARACFLVYIPNNKGISVSLVSSVSFRRPLLLGSVRQPR